MKDVTPKKSRDELIRERLHNNPLAMEEIFNHVAQGGSLVELAELWEIPYWAIAAYTNHKDRSAVLTRAMVLRSEYWAESVKKLLKELTESNIQDFFRPDGTLLPVDEMPVAKAAAIQSLKVVEYFEGDGKEKMQVGFTKEIKFWDKTKSIEMLAKTLGMFVEKHEHKHVHSLEDIINASHTVIDIDSKQD